MTLISSYGGPDSNGYISLTEANSFILTAIPEGVLCPTLWTDLSTVAQEASIMMATIDIDSRQYVGNRFFFDQHLEFPRELRSAFPFNRTTVRTFTEDTIQKRMKRSVQEACAYQALHIARHQGRSTHLSNIAQGIRGISESVGPIREFVQYGQRISNQNAKFEPTALALLQEWMTTRRVWRA